MENPVKQLMKENDLTKVQFVDKLRYKVSQSSIYGWLGGSHVPTLGNVNLILDQFDMNEEEKRRWRLKFKKWQVQKRRTH